MGKKLILIFLTGLSVMLLLRGLGNAPLERWDEVTNINVVRETLKSPDFPILVLNGRPFFEKPPLWYWLSMIPVSITGLTLTGARLTSAFSGLILLFLVYSYSVRYFSWKSGILSVLFLLSTTQLYVASSGGFFSTHTLRSADSDGLFVLFFTAAAVFFIPDRNNSGLRRAFASFLCGLAVLTKGPAGLIPLVAYALYEVLQKTDRRNFSVRIVSSVLTALAVVLPWHILMYAKYGSGFFATYAGYHLLLRVAQGLEGHNAPWWYYAKILSSFDMFPAFPVVIYTLLRLMGRTGKLIKTPELFIPVMTLFFYLAVIVTAKTRLAWYVLPVYPLLAMIASPWPEEKFRSVKLMYPALTVYLLGFAVRNLFLLM